MDNWQKFNGNTKPPKEAFYSKLNFEGISYADYEHGKKVWEVFKIKNLGEYHDLYVHTLLMFVKTLEISVLNYMNLTLTLRIFCLHQISMKSMFKKDESRIRIINRH